MKEDIKKYSNKELANQFRVYNYMVSNEECFGVRDVKILLLLEKEIIKRNGIMKDNKVIINNKEY
jgi:hypothetical protein